MQFKKLPSGCTEQCPEAKTGDGIKILKRPNTKFHDNFPKCDNINSSTNCDKSDTDVNSESKQYTFRPLHIRVKEYFEARDRIFNEKSSPSRSARRIRDFWRNVKSVKKKIICSVLDRPSDIRPYAEVVLFGEKMLGLMDTGASWSQESRLKS